MHCNFGAGFSGTDTADEISTKLFGVIGNILSAAPSMAWRAGCNQKFVTLQFDDIFDSESDKTYSVGDDCKDRVKEYVFPKATYGTWNNTPAKKWVPTTATRAIGAPSVDEYDIYGGYGGFGGYDAYEHGNYDPFLDNIYKNGTGDTPRAGHVDPVGSGIAWASPEYYDGVCDFDLVFDTWIEQVNDNAAEGTVNRMLISQFFDMVNSCDQLDLNFLKYVVNELPNYTTPTEWLDLIDHINAIT